jgi:antitoxin (DNA-binding transcriptional repressor) of toxin-antitoxin stability system
MLTVGAFEAKTRLSSLLERVERGEEVWSCRRRKSLRPFFTSGFGF